MPSRPGAHLVPVCSPACGRVGQGGVGDRTSRRFGPGPCLELNSLEPAPAACLGGPPSGAGPRQGRGSLRR
ncbi:hypothetical protein NDU88_009649 [Pleurodeles waltl]|uniref:Uncharacterized protein n=1 Tax=Pleurodeles waltl TaxID=8319 RepID=A0AAV7QTL3_PLEWA|nr:hypothetical protein NDU88_009649 [Pleurodeles waltl]